MNKEIEYLKEHLYEIYKYKKSMKDLTYDMDLEHLLRTCKALDYLQQELERYKNIIDELEDWINSWVENEEYCYLANNPRDLGRKDVFEEVLNKLKELKGNDD